eukprot:gene31505-38076_t
MLTCFLLVVFAFCILLNVGAFCSRSYRQPSSCLWAETPTLSQGGSIAAKFPELQRCLAKEYASFFKPMERRFYSPDVQFIDPLTSFRGIDKYQSNVDMLAGRSTMGKFLFEDASIVLHNVEVLSDNQLQTRWTLQVTVKAPWQPRAKFTGISLYTLDSEGRVAKQEDYWDSVNLINGHYVKKGVAEGLGDFAEQLQKPSGAELSAPEMPYELLRRAKYYEVRRYPQHLAAEIVYDKRPDGYDSLGSYCGGSNVNKAKVPYFSPTIMTIEDEVAEGGNAARRKVMRWPLVYNLPGQPAPALSDLPAPTISSVRLVSMPARTVAVYRFPAAATEVVVKQCTRQLVEMIRRDGLIASKPAESATICVVGQFDALFSLNKRRNEVWVDLDEHPWK